MDESDVDICQASNNTDVLKEEIEEFTDDLESGSGTCADQEKDGANVLGQEWSTRPISAVPAPSSVLEDCCFESNSSEVVTENDTNHQNNGDCSRKNIVQELLEEKKSSTSREFNLGFQDDPVELCFEYDQSIDTGLKDDPSVSVPGGPRSSSPAFGFQEMATEISELYKFRNYSASISDDELSFPDVPQDDLTTDFVDRSSIDGGSVVSHGSSHSLSKSYLYSSVSVGEDIPNSLQDVGYHLIPKFKANGKGFCWPMDKLPLSGDRKFEEDAQWEISKPIGYGAYGECFLGYPKDKKDKPFCVKKCQYKEEEVKALCLAAKEIYYAKNISEGARKIVSFYGATYYKPNVCIFMEYMEEGFTVKDAIKEAIKQYKDGLEKTDCVNYSKDVLLALAFIHKKGILHNDVKANNVLLSASRVEAKLCDFGKASAISPQQSASKDIWSGGCFLLEMLGIKYSSALASGLANRPNKTVLEQLPGNIDQDTKQVLSMCFCADRSQCTASYVLTSEFFREN